MPTLLGDAYYSIHLPNSYHGGMIICCTPLLYRWFISHMPQSDVFWDVKKEPRWDPKIMALNHSDIDWYHRAYQEIEIIVVVSPMYIFLVQREELTITLFLHGDNLVICRGINRIVFI